MSLTKQGEKKKMEKKKTEGEDLFLKVFTGLISLRVFLVHKTVLKRVKLYKSFSSFYNFFFLSPLLQAQTTCILSLGRLKEFLILFFLGWVLG